MNSALRSSTSRAFRRRIGVIVDRNSLARWQAEALRTLADDFEFIVYSCTNSRPARRRLRHALYYLLNLLTIRNPQTSRVPWPADLPLLNKREFDSTEQRGWQELPADLLEELRKDGVAAIIKFGMGLLRIPSADRLSVPILSYHHGNPAEFRGRPAGFHEMLAGRSVMGQVVQQLSNELDAGDVVASAESKILAHSYRSTLLEAYRLSPLILKRAVENSFAGRHWRPDQWGRNYRLPSNGRILRFLLKQCREAVKRLFYGLFREKRWQVATIALPKSPTIDSLQTALSQQSEWQITPTPPGFRFLADPFFHPGRGLLVEGLSKRSCRGEILHVHGDEVQRLSGRGGHFSYPALFAVGERWYLVPEISDWSPAWAFPLGEDGLGEPMELKIPGRPTLLDPTLHHEDGTLFLFANRADEGASVLRLWIARGLQDEFAEHPSSPIRISPNGSRMAGNLLIIDDGRFRAGQDLRRGYGDGLTFFRVTQLDPYSYAEEAEHDLRFDHVRGPHTLNLAKGRAAFDFYVESFTAFAGVRRLRERRAARRVG
jgi:hypothetical protein